MADGLNAAFKKNPFNFVQTHDLMVSPQPVGSRALTGGATVIELVMSDASIVPKVVRLESYALRTHHFFSEAGLSAFYLPAIVDQSSTIPITAAGPEYMFTPDLSGCLFAAYGPSNDNLTVEHVNVRTINGAGLIGFRANQLINANHAYLFMITPQPIANAPATAVTYTTGGVVVGVRNIGGAWNFIYRVDGAATALV